MIFSKLSPVKLFLLLLAFQAILALFDYSQISILDKFAMWSSEHLGGSG